MLFRRDHVEQYMYINGEENVYIQRTHRLLFLLENLTFVITFHIKLRNGLEFILLRTLCIRAYAIHTIHNGITCSVVHFLTRLTHGCSKALNCRLKTVNEGKFNFVYWKFHFSKWR